jgi:alpha-glucosidase
MFGSLLNVLVFEKCDAHENRWNGDNSGSWEYIRFQIPTVLGSGLSAQAHTSGDVDGIFGGSPDTCVAEQEKIKKTFAASALLCLVLALLFFLLS